jgi:hypothetical protein
MSYVCDILLDDWAFIEIASDEMRSCADDFYTAGVCLVIGLCSLKSWQEGVMDVDDFSRHSLAEFGAKHLHVSSKNHEINL